MRILHIMLSCFYIDNFSYQENLLPKYHFQSGNEVKIVASNFTFNNNGEGVYLKGRHTYNNEFGISVVRVEFAKNIFSKLFKKYSNLQKELIKFNPDIIFVHGCQFLDLKKIVKYVKKNSNVKLFIDNHADFNNSGKNWLSKHILHGIIWKHLAHKALPYTKMFYGVTPARVDFLTDVYKLPKEKVRLLPLGADDEIVKKALNPAVKVEKRKLYNLSDKDFVIITGGKIDKNKSQIIDFMGTINKCDNSAKLLVFGSVTEELKEKFDAQISDKVKYIGWKKSEEIYYEFAAADLVVFPGLHSVLWEQAVGMGKPCIFKYIKGFNHVDLGGNCLFFEKDDIEEYKLKVYEAIKNIDKMKAIAEQKGIEIFSYSEIAKKSIEIK